MNAVRSRKSFAGGNESVDGRHGERLWRVLPLLGGFGVRIDIVAIHLRLGLRSRDLIASDEEAVNRRHGEW